jgi:endonuclease I
VRSDLLPKNYLAAHMIAANSNMIFKDYGHVKGQYEDCEHRAFHMKAINKDNAKIMITKEVLFF